MEPVKITHLSLMLGWRCNSDCVVCWQAWSRANHRLAHQEVDINLLKQVLRRYQNTLRSVELCSFGEPLMYSGFTTLFNRLKQLGIFVNLITNGSLLDKCDVETLPGQLTISIDSPVAEVYESMRNGLEFKTVRNNLVNAVNNPSKHPERLIGINMVVIERNASHVLPMAEFAATHGANYLSYLRGAALSKTTAAAEELQQDDQRVCDAIAQARTKFGAQLAINDYFSDVGLAPSNETRAKATHCRYPWYAFDIGPDGHAHPCCRAYEVDFGTAFPAEPEHSPRAVALREQLATPGLLAGFPTCNACPMR